MANITSKIRFLIMAAIVLICSCDTALDPNNLYPTDFTGQISCSFGTAIIRPDHSLWFVNDDFKDGQIVVVPNAKKFEKISSLVSIELVEGMQFAVDIYGNIWYWGYWAPSSSIPTPVNDPIKISSLKGVKVIDYSTYAIYMLRNDGTVWKVNFHYGEPTKYLQSERIPGLKNIIKISNGFALKRDGTLYELENRKPEYGGYIGQVNDVVDIENTLGRRTYVVKKDGTVWGWGMNDFGEFGDGTKETKTYPVQVKDLSDIVKISCNYDYNLALKKDGTVWFWGYLGKDENNVPRATSEPFKIEGLENVLLIEASFNSFFMKNDGSFWYYNVFTKEFGKILFD